MKIKTKTKWFLLVLCLLFVGVFIFLIHDHSAKLADNSVGLAQANLPAETTVSALPVRLIIPSIKIDATIEHLGVLPDGSMDAPAGPNDVAWLDLGTRPGQIGSAVIDGHSGFKNNHPAVFDNLYKLKIGDEINVTDDQGVTISFVVQKVQSYKADATVPSVFGSTDGLAHLNLITCDGVWNPAAQTHSSRLVVFAEKE